ncbi:MAG TPA: hypothetical protein VMT00_15535 [Thermoanaerobaculia bacterium]|nr:hypothetical protein [Thermoanaerobaculia bacterium]
MTSAHQHPAPASTYGPPGDSPKLDGWVAVIARLFANRAFLLLFWCLFTAFGIALAFGNGIGGDEQQEAMTLDVNVEAVTGLLGGDRQAWNRLESWPDRYYGIGFHVAALPLQMALTPIYERVVPVSRHGAFLLAKHVAVFALFAASCILFYRLSRLLVDPAASHLFTFLYATYPYLLGHGSMNVKDAPFMIAWLLCTLISLRMSTDIVTTGVLSYRSTLLLLLATGWLVSIRIAGVLILVQYAVTGATALAATRKQHPSAIRQAVAPLATFLLLLPPLVIASHPVFWTDPMRVFDALSYMSSHPLILHTRVFGIPVSAQDLPWSYIPLWLAAKLPLLVIPGILLAPVALTRLSGDRVRFTTLVSLTAAVVLLPAILVLRGAVLYNDLRQLLFLVPLLLLAGLVSMYHLFPRLTIAGACLTLALFAIDNVRLFPYQYVWLNEAARIVDADRMFTADYWGTSGREMAAFIRRARAANRWQCVYASPLQVVQPFLESQSCLASAEEIRDDSPRPFVAGVTYGATGVTFGSPAPPDGCRVALTVTRRLTLAPLPMTIARVYECR